MRLNKPMLADVMCLDELLYVKCAKKHVLNYNNN